jgi:predicted nucleic acid-binding protein
MRGYLLDTNHFAAAVRPRTNLRQRLLDAHRAGAKIGTCIPVLCELEVGGLQVRNTALFQRSLNELMRVVRIWPIDRETARRYGDIFHEVRSKGRVLSQVDMIVAALARQMGITVLTTDRDFEALPDLAVEDWTSLPENTP